MKKKKEIKKSVLMSGLEWAEMQGVQILEPDGWWKENVSMDTPISGATYDRLRNASTVRYKVKKEPPKFVGYEELVTQVQKLQAVIVELQNKLEPKAKPTDRVTLGELHCCVKFNLVGDYDSEDFGVYVKLDCCSLEQFNEIDGYCVVLAQGSHTPEELNAKVFVRRVG